MTIVNCIGKTQPTSPAQGGTGVNNGSSTVAIGGNVTFSGAYTFSGTLTGNTSVTFPTSGTLLTTSSTGALVFLGSAVASNSATVNFNNLLTSTYDTYFISIENASPVSNGVDFLCQVGTGSTPTYQTSSYTGAIGYMSTTSAGGGSTSSSGASLVFGSRWGNASTNGANGFLYLYNANNNASYKTILGQISYYASDVSVNNTGFPSISWGGTTTLTSVRFSASSGNISTGTFRLYGIAK
ncbi:MAG: hypothetical protein RLZZ196_1477 [Bacteroidota bacterium]|jgi:hypothetical protein